MQPREITCKMCGGKFIYEGRAPKKYCSDECKDKAEKISKAVQRENRRIEKAKKRARRSSGKGENDDAIFEIAAKAAALGMSYGQYVARGLA